MGDLARGGGARGSAQRLTVAVWLADWLRVDGHQWEAVTVRERSDTADRLINPYLGSLRLGEVTRRDIKRWRGDLVNDGVTAYRANRAVAILSAALGVAVDDELLATNPCAHVRKLAYVKQGRTPATLQEIEWLRAELIDPVDRLVVSLMAYAGLRPGEVQAVEWGDVRETSIRVHRGRRISGRTKTNTDRATAIIPALAQDLEEVGRGRGLVCPVDWNNWTLRRFRPARVRAGVERMPYELRHGFASLLIAEGRTVLEVAYRMGHSSPKLVQDTYGHLFDEAQLRKGESMAKAATRVRREVTEARLSGYRYNPV